ncbi:hypothetical protein [Gorillibacterium sp. CAU 1737]|uniref:hypothetical protein n=1 Tax=Gorillibacterium sp. CAU 1737 TaxID=3140362 RepID=UPI0032609B85
MTAKKQSKTELEQVLLMAESRLSGFPEGLKVDGFSYIQNSRRMLDEATGPNRICFLLPYWLKEQCQLTDEICREMAVGNLFLMLHYFIVDDAMDTSDRQAVQDLPMAALFFGEFLNGYSRLFPYDSEFWSYYRSYVSEWAASVSEELKGIVFTSDPAKIARKASPLKLCSTGALLLANQSSEISRVSRLLEEALVAMQMADDWVDWEADLVEDQGKGNSLLSLVRSSQGKPPDASLTEADVKRFLFLDEGLTCFSLLAARRYEACDYSGLKLEALRLFHDALLRDLQRGAMEIAEARRQLEQGGLHYWLSRASSSS